MKNLGKRIHSGIGSIGRKAARFVGIFPLEKRSFSFEFEGGERFQGVAKRGNSGFTIWVSTHGLREIAGLKLPASSPDKRDAMARGAHAVVTEFRTGKTNQREVLLVNLTRKDMTIRDARKRSKNNNYFLGKNEQGKIFLFFTEG